MTEQEFFLNGWLVEVDGGRISRDQKTVHLEPQIMKALAFLASNHNQVVSKDRLIDAIWGHSSVSDAALTRCIFEIRQAFGENARNSEFVETVPKVGYRLVASLQSPKKKRRLRPMLSYGLVAASVIAISALLIWGTQSNEINALNPNQSTSLTQNPLANDAFQKGLTHYKKNAYLNNENAIALFEKAVELEPSFALAHTRLADALIQQSRNWGGTRLDDARAAASKAIELDPLNPQSHNAYGVVLLLSEDIPGALDSFQSAYTLDPTHWKSAYNAAVLYKERLEFKKAESLFLQTLKQFPEHVTAMGHLGFLYVRMGKIENAKQWLNRALEEAPLETYAWAEMGVLEMVTGNTAEAIKNCQRVRQFFPNHRGCVQVIAVSYLMAGDMAAAQEWFDYAAANLPYPSYARLGKAQILLADEQSELGLKIVKNVQDETYRAIFNSDDSWEKHWIIAACYALQGDKQNAFVWLEKAAERGRRFYLWDSKDPVFVKLHGDPRFDRYIAMTNSVTP